MTDLLTAAPAAITIVDVPEGAAQPIGHYAHAVELDNGIVYLSGQKAWDPVTGDLVPGDVEAQTGIVFDNIEGVLRHLGLTLSHVTRISCHLARVEDYEAFNRAYARRLGGHRPARTTLAGYQLRGGAAVELVAEAYRPAASGPRSPTP